jgi:hypothetical protein
MGFGDSAFSLCTASRARAVAALALPTIACASCLFPEAPVPPIPDTVSVEVASDGVTVALLRIANDNGVPLEVCLDNVVIQPENGGASCSYAGMGGCLVVHDRTVVGRVPFRATGRCELSPGWVRVIADVRFRPRPEHADDPRESWRTTTVLADARASSTRDVRQSRR